MSAFSTINYITPSFMVRDKHSIYGHAIEKHVTGNPMAFVATLNRLFALFNWYLDANHIDLLLSILFQLRINVGTMNPIDNIL
jgi:hypothetical protein